MRCVHLSWLADYIANNTEKSTDKGHKVEEAINKIDEDLTRYLIDLSSEPLSQKESEVLKVYFDSSEI